MQTSHRKSPKEKKINFVLKIPIFGILLHFFFLQLCIWASALSLIHLLTPHPKMHHPGKFTGSKANEMWDLKVLSEMFLAEIILCVTLKSVSEG